MDRASFKDTEQKARYYSRIKYGLSIGEAVFFFIWCIIWQASGISTRLTIAIEAMAATENPFIIGPVFVACFLLFIISCYSPRPSTETFCLNINLDFLMRV